MRDCFHIRALTANVFCGSIRLWNFDFSDCLKPGLAHVLMISNKFLQKVVPTWGPHSHKALLVWAHARSTNGNSIHLNWSWPVQDVLVMVSRHRAVKDRRRFDDFCGHYTMLQRVSRPTFHHQRSWVMGTRFILDVEQNVQCKEDSELQKLAVRKPRKPWKPYLFSVLHRN